MYSHKEMNVNKFRIPTIKQFFQRGKVWNFQMANCIIHWWWMQRKRKRK